MKSNTGKERPGIFNIWRNYVCLKCPTCEARWHDPNFSHDEFSFNCTTSPDWPDCRTAIPTVYCPACGKQFPDAEQLLANDNASLNPIHGRYFAGTGPKLDAFLEAAQGFIARLWEYQVSHSYLTLELHSPVENTDAYLVCRAVSNFNLPSKQWESSLKLIVDNELRDWILFDTKTDAKIECAGIGVFHELESVQ